MNVKPCLRWVGGKTQLLPQLLKHVPVRFNAYHEPFLGGGALYFALNPKEAHLSDLNPRLVNAYGQISHDVQGVITHLRTFQRTSTCYYEQRAKLNAEVAMPEELDAEAAARFLFLNKTCFNGLWRENAGGAFNVPYGGDKKSKFYDANNLLECSIRLRASAHVRCEDFEHCQRAVEGDLVYFDPPYIPVKATSFVDYVSDGFGASAQKRLRDLAWDLKSRGVHVMLSNSDTSLTRELYKGFELHEVQARRSVNSNGLGRGKVGELIIL